MQAVMYLLQSSITKKYVMGLTGIAWALFVMAHMLGNLLIFVGPDAYNWYGHVLVSNPFIYVAEAGLVLTLVLHATTGMALTVRNKNARPEGYLVTQPSAAKASTWSSRTMIYTGSLLLAFIIYHLITFKFGPYYETIVKGETIRDLHRLMVEVFQNPLYVVGYIVCLVLVGFHLSHGFQASLQSLGFRHPRYTPALKVFSSIYGWVVAVGFISQPIYVFFFHRG